MDKLITLQSFEKQAEIMLDRDEMQIYLLLLATCNDKGGGKLHWDSARRALGETLTLPRLELACRTLTACGLIESVNWYQTEYKEDKPCITYQLRLPE